MKVEYDGGPFAGWQRQDGPASVQQTLEEALRRLDASVTTIAAAGRTDSGVHATGQVAHADMARDWEPFRLMEALNYHLKPNPIAITACAAVADDWHARFSALERRYMFRLVTRRAPVTTDKGLVWHVTPPLDLEPMQRAAKLLEGEHDFTTFRATHCQANSPIKTLDAAEVSEHPYPGGQEFQFRFRARSFLHNQVRSMVGTLERVGAGAWTPHEVGHALAAADRSQCGPVCPPQGLYLVGVQYPQDPFAG